MDANNRFVLTLSGGGTPSNNKAAQTEYPQVMLPAIPNVLQQPKLVVATSSDTYFKPNLNAPRFPSSNFLPQRSPMHHSTDLLQSNLHMTGQPLFYTPRYQQLPNLYFPGFQQPIMYPQVFPNLCTPGFIEENLYAPRRQQYSAPIIPPSTPIIPPSTPIIPPSTPIIPPSTPKIPPSTPIIPPRAPLVPRPSGFINQKHMGVATNKPRLYQRKGPNLQYVDRQAPKGWPNDKKTHQSK